MSSLFVLKSFTLCVSKKTVNKNDIGKHCNFSCILKNTKHLACKLYALKTAHKLCAAVPFKIFCMLTMWVKKRRTMEKSVRFHFIFITKDTLHHCLIIVNIF